MKVGDHLVVDIEALGFEGLSIARVDGLVIFVDDGLPGDRLRITLRKKKKKYFHASIDEIVQASASRVTPRCSHTLDCGGCRWQHCDYNEQTAWKQRHTVDCFERLAKVSYGELRPILPSPQVFNYRNKMEFSFSARRWMSAAEIASGESIDRDFALGLHAPGRYDAVIDVSVCHLQHDECNTILDSVRSKAKELGVKAYSDKAQSGFLRHLVLRRTLYRDQLMVILITMTPSNEAEHEMVRWLGSEFADGLRENSTVLHAVKDSLSPVAQGALTILRGSGSISEWSHDVEFRISPFSFFQTNSYQIPTFLQTTFDAAQLRQDMTVWDLYCGTGSITLPVAKQVRKVIGIELSAQSIEDARHNAQLNDLRNVDFYAADLHRKETIDFLQGLERPDVVILDPPRAGIHEGLLAHLIRLRIPRIVYVSCNPATQARDCAILNEVYEVQSMQAMDMFPHTFHVENVAVLTLRKHDS